MIDWALYTWKTVPFVAHEAKKWWKRDTAKNLSRLVEKRIESRTSWPKGVRDQLVEQWLFVRDDRWLSTIVRGLLEDQDHALEPLLKTRLLELLADLPLIRGTEETAELLTSTILDQLSQAQKTSDEKAHADQRRTYRALEKHDEKVNSKLDGVPPVRWPADRLRPGVVVVDFDG